MSGHGCCVSVVRLGLCYVVSAVCGQTWAPTTAVTLSWTLTANVHPLCVNAY